MEMATSLIVNAHPVGPGIRKGGNKLVRILDHQMTIQWQLGHLSQAFHHWWTDRNIRHKVSVHDVNMDHSPAAPFSRGHFVRQPCEIRRKYRWKQLNHGCL